MAKLSAGVPALLEIEPSGARQIRRAVPGALLVFLAPPSPRRPAAGPELQAAAESDVLQALIGWGELRLAVRRGEW